MDVGKLSEKEELWNSHHRLRADMRDPNVSHVLVREDKPRVRHVAEILEELLPDPVYNFPFHNFPLNHFNLGHIFLCVSTFTSDWMHMP